MVDTVLDATDALPGPMAPEHSEAAPFDFRRPSTFAREHVRSLEVAHEVFQRRFASRLSNALRTAVQLEPLSAEQLTYDDYIRSMSNPTVLTTVTLPPLPDAAVLEMNVGLALVLIDRLLGGRGLPATPRRPTEVETFLIRELMAPALDAFGETLEPLVPVTPELNGIDYNPQLVQIVPPSEVVLLLTYRLVVGHNPRTEGLVTVCYPYATLSPALDRLANTLWLDPHHDDGDTPEPGEPLGEHLPDLRVEMGVRLNDSPSPAAELVSLQVGDVLRLDHRAAAPLRGHVGGRDVLLGRIGRRGRRLALQVTGWCQPLPEPSAPGSWDRPPPGPTAFTAMGTLPATPSTEETQS